MLGAWEVKVNVGGFPQKIASALEKLNEMVGAEYTPIAYLGSQVVNGTNHAVLAEQTIITGKDTKNAVIVFFRETKEGVAISGIERVLESGGPLGGVQVDIKTDIPEEAMTAFKTTFEGFVGSKIEPFALLGTQVTKGTNYIFAAKVTGVTAEPETKVCMITANPMTKDIAFADLLDSKHDVMSLGYAFTWLKRGASFGAPLGEWP